MIIKISTLKIYYNNMEIRENNTVYIIAPICNKIDKYKFDKLSNLILNEKRNTAIDLSYVQDCTIDFIEGLKALAKKKTIGIFNIPSDLFVLFNVMQLDKSINFYVSEGDFETNSHQLINRHFTVV